jgi:hypothetical protein
MESGQPVRSRTIGGLSVSAVVVPTAVVRDVAVSAGASEFVWTQLTELGGIDISFDSFSVALMPRGEVPTLIHFVEPTTVEFTDDPSVIRVGLKVDALTVATRGDHTLWARVVDVSETLVFPASGTVQLS